MRSVTLCEVSGGLVRGRMQGQGEMTWPSGDKYIGDWEEDARHGFGLYLYGSGNRYKGQYVSGKKVRRERSCRQLTEC